MVAANNAKRVRIAVGLTGLLASLFFGISLFAFFQSSKSQQELSYYKEQHRLLIEEYQDLSLQVEQLRNAHHSIEELLQENRERLSQSEQARITLEKKKFQDQLDTIEEKQNYIRLRQKLWSNIRKRLALEIESNQISFLRVDDQFIIRIPNNFLFAPASVQIIKGTPIETATPIAEGSSPKKPEDEEALPLPEEGTEPAEIEPSPAESLLAKVASILNTQLPDIPVLIEGHTDNVPIGSSLRSRFPTNWELSSARATATVRYLQQVGEVSPSRMTAVGRADTAPITENHAKKGNPENRRVDIIINLDEQSLSTLFSPPSTSSPADTVSQIHIPFYTPNYSIGSE